MEENHHTISAFCGFCSVVITCLPSSNWFWRRFFQISPENSKITNSSADQSDAQHVSTIDMASPQGSGGAQSAGLQPSTFSYGDSTMASRLENATSLTIKVLKDITDDFSEERNIGQGAYGGVYVGMLESGEEIAVKKLYNTMPGIDAEQFKHEFENLMRLEHQNIVRLVGYCYESQYEPMYYEGRAIFAERTHRALCFEYMQNGSLQKYLSDEYEGLDWHTRYKIIKGTCEGLKYLHEGFKEPIYHLDLKPDNILLDNNMEPKLADFGLSKLFGDEQTKITQSPIGTLGYLPMEYLHGKIVSSKLDIFSLGVIMTKIIAGPNCFSRSDEMPYEEFLDLVHANWRNRLQKIHRASRPLDAYCEQVNICTDIAKMCVDIDRHKRPNITDIINQMIHSEAVIHEALSLSANSRSWMQGDLVKVRAFTRSKAIPRVKTCSKFPVLVRARAAPWCHAEEMPRVGIDVVVLLDADLNSVLPWRLNIFKQALMVFADKLSPNDRLAIVSVEDKEHRTMKLTYMSNQGQNAAKLMLSELAGNHGNNTLVALQEGAEIMSGREKEEADSRFGYIMLLSSSRDEAILTKKISSEFPVHTFGLGEYHGTEIMKYIADKTSGTYSFPGVEYIKAFELLIKDITSIVATSIKITLTVPEGVTISTIETGGYANFVSLDKQSGTINIDNMYAGERKNFIVYLTVGEGNKKLLTIGGRYQSFDTSKQLRDVEVFIQRPCSRCSPRKLAINRKVATELTRIRYEKVLSGMVEQNSLSNVALLEQWNQIRCLDEGRIATEKAVDDLGQNVTFICKITKNSRYCGNPKEAPYIMSWLSCHKWQRGSLYHSGAFTRAQHADADGDDDDDDE